MGLRINQKESNIYEAVCCLMSCGVMEPFVSDPPCWVMMYYPRAGGRGVRTAAARKAAARAAAGEGFVVDGDS